MRGNTMTVLQNRVQAQNALTAYINTVVPLLIERFNDGVKYKNDGSPIKKHKVDFDAILADKPEKVRGYIDWGDYSISIKFDTNFSTGDFGCQYIDQYVYLFNRQDDKSYDFTPLDMITETTITDAKIELKRLQALASDIAAQICVQSRILNK
jgi:hypothetical protein